MSGTVTSLHVEPDVMADAEHRARFRALETQVSLMAEHLADMHRDLRAVADAVGRLVDDRVPLRMLVERAVAASERAVVASSQVLECSKTCPVHRGGKP